MRTKPLYYHGDDYDWIVDDLQQEDIVEIMQMLNPTYQEELRNRFRDYGAGYSIVRNISDEEFKRMFGI